MPSEAQLRRMYMGGRPSFSGGGYQGGSRLIDLIMARGQQQADATRQQGEIWGNAIQNIGQQVGGALEKQAAEKKEKAQTLAFDAAIESGDPRKIIAVLGPRDGPAVVNALKAHAPDGMKAYGDRMSMLRDQALGIKAVPAERRPQAYTFARNSLLSAGVVKPEEAPEQYDEAFIDQLAHYGEKPTGPSLMPVDPGQSVIDKSNPQGGALYTAPAKAAAPPSVGSFEDYVVRSFGENPTPQQIAQARKEYGQADDRQRIMMPIVVQTAEGPQIVDRGSGQARAITGAGGTPLGAMPTSEQRNRIAATQRAQPVLDSVAELSEKINTLQGVVAKASGAAEKEKAKLNLSDDVAEYQALVSGFTPMLARMVGHTGVLTEQDVQSVRTMLPQPGDSKSVRDRKVARIKKILSSQGGSSAPSTADPLGLR